MTTNEINALKRLQRVGDPESETNRKVREAVVVIVNYLADIVPPAGSCPEHTALARFGLMLMNGTFFLEEEPGDWAPVDYEAPLRVLHLFAEVVARGLVERVESAHRFHSYQIRVAEQASPGSCSVGFVLWSQDAGGRMKLEEYVPEALVRPVEEGVGLEIIWLTVPDHPFLSVQDFEFEAMVQAKQWFSEKKRADEHFAQSR
jgi:hypothetical protein